MRYGTIPVVRNAGGMSDTAFDARPERISKGVAAGFQFDQPTRAGLAACVERELTYYRQPMACSKLQQAAMQVDFSWRRSAAEYAALYRAFELGEAPAVDEVPNAAKLTA